MTVQMHVEMANITRSKITYYSAIKVLEQHHILCRKKMSEEKHLT